ncbi:TPA: PucR family transcriptional regulator [Klebsiella pneumoniae]|uniref:PucR family transcriptional regulator n=1 Tax=Klebsiella pneumoniae TaxID=573 RepID=UPI0018874044|nr:PucR family transcriptional regulator ligand-binding domain-containing protein [Klebsiella pneumoniae]
MSLTVSELLALEGLSALRLRAGKQGLQRAVRWYYVAENEHIAEWIMGGELVFITGINHPRDEANLIQLLMEGKQRGIAGMVILTGINHPRDEANLIQLLMEGKQRGIAGMVILTGEAYIHAIPATLIALADELGMPLIEQPYLLKMVIVTERIGTALVHSENVLQSQRDILMQLVTGDYPDLQMLHQRALHQQLDFTRPLRLAALRLEGLSRLFRQFPPEQAEAWLLQAHRSVRQQLQQQLNQQGNSFPLLERSNMFLFLLPDEEGEGFQQKKWLQQWLQALADGEESLSLLCGLSAPVRQLQGYPRALSQARQALDLCDTLRPTQRISDYQQLGFIKLLSAVSDPALLNDFMHDTLGCLIEPGRKAPWLLLETLETLLQENGNVVRAADRLGLHRNTLHQRIQRIEKLTGYPVSHPQFHLNASVALVIWRLSQNHLQDPP